MGLLMGSRHGTQALPELGAPQWVGSQAALGSACPDPQSEALSTRAAAAFAASRNCRPCLFSCLQGAPAPPSNSFPSCEFGVILRVCLYPWDTVEAHDDLGHIVEVWCDFSVPHNYSLTPPSYSEHLLEGGICHKTTQILLPLQLPPRLRVWLPFISSPSSARLVFMPCL